MSSRHLNAKALKWESNENGCFVVTSHNASSGKMKYPLMRIHGKQHKIHRYIFEECFGKIPDGMVVRHKCDNPKCINPEHLELGTQADNIADMDKKGRRISLSGVNNGRAKLTSEKVKEIRQEHTNSIAKLSKMYGISESQISRILKNESWKETR